MDVARLGEPQVIAKLLKDLSVFTRATGDEEFEILSVGRTDDQGRRRVAFRQLIGGIPVDTQSKLEVGPDGDVWHLITRVFDPSVPPAELLSEQEARRIASEVIERTSGPLGNAKIEWIPAELVYVAKATSQEEYGIALTPIWRLSARITTANDPVHAHGETVLVVINAETAEANVIQDTKLYSPY